METMTVEGNPTFHLTTAAEYGLLSKPRACWPIRRMQYTNRDDYMLVRIDPPLIGQYFGLGGADVHELLLATRHKGYTLFPVKEYPVDVYVVRIVDQSVLSAQSFTVDQVQLLAWGVIFKNLQDAYVFARKWESNLL